MEDKKYELVKEDKIDYSECSIYRIKPLKDFGDVKAGDLGGYIEKEENLSQEGNCWVYDNAKVRGNAQVYDNAQVFGETQVGGKAQIFGNAQVFENAKVSGSAEVYGYTKIYNDAEVSGSAKVYDEAQVFGKAQVYGYAEVFGKAQAFGNTEIYNEAKVYDNALVFGKTEVYDKAQIYGYAQVYENAQVFGNAQVYNNAKIYDKAEIFTDIEIGGETEVKGNEKLFNHSQYIDNLAKVYENITTDEKTKTYDFSNKKDYSSNLENEIQKFEEHCSKVVDKLKLQDELPDFQVISQKGLLYERNGEENNISEIKNFIENLKGEEYWDNMNLKDIRDWKELKNDEFVSIVYETKDDKGEYDDNSIKDFTCYNDYADYSEKAIKESLEDTLRHNPSLYKRIEENVIAVQKEAGVYKEKTFGDVEFYEITDKKEEVKEKEEVKNMKGYGKEVYITENDDTTERIINGKKYIIETTSYYDDETGDSSFKIVAKNENGSRVYEYSEYSDFDNYDEECYQDTSIVDDEFLKELNKTTNKKLPTQEEIENKYSKKEVEQETDKEDSKLQNLKDYLENAVNVENEIDKFSDKMEVIVDKLNLIDKLPVFKVMTEEGILYSSDKGSVDFQDKDGNMVYERTKLFDEIKDKMGEEFFNNMNMNDIRDWENFKNNSDITLVYDSYGQEGDYCLKEYSDFNSYAKETVKPFLVQEISKNPELGDILKENIIKDDKVKENNKEIKEKEVAKDDREMDF